MAIAVGAIALVAMWVIFAIAFSSPGRKRCAPELGSRRRPKSSTTSSPGTVRPRRRWPTGARRIALPARATAPPSARSCTTRCAGARPSPRAWASDTPRALVLGAAPRALGMSPEEVSATADGSEHAVAPLSEAEKAGLAGALPCRRAAARRRRHTRMADAVVRARLRRSARPQEGAGARRPRARRSARQHAEGDAREGR